MKPGNLPILVAGVMLPALLGAAYPEKPVRIVTPFPAASVTDVLARSMAGKMTEGWGRSVIVDNRAGAGGNLGADIVAKSAPDGYTLLMGTNGTNAINASLYQKMPYDTLRDFAPVSLVATSYLLLVVHPSVPANSVRELIALAKRKPGQLNCATAGNGTTPHLASELFKTMAGVNMLHVPYKGSPQVMVDLLAGRADVYFANATTVLPFLHSGRLKFLATSGARREASLPEIPTISEAGLPGFEANSWFGLFAPAGTAADIVDRIHSETARIVTLPDLRKQFANLGLAPVSNTPTEYSAFVRREVEKWAKVVKASGAKAD